MIKKLLTIIKRYLPEDELPPVAEGKLGHQYYRKKDDTRIEKRDFIRIMDARCGKYTVVTSFNSHYFDCYSLSDAEELAVEFQKLYKRDRNMDLNIYYWGTKFLHDFPVREIIKTHNKGTFKCIVKDGVLSVALSKEIK